MNKMRRILITGGVLSISLVMTLLWAAGGIAFAAAPQSVGTTSITLLINEANQNTGKGIMISARLQDADRPLGNQPVEFEITADFFGENRVGLGTTLTDATGTATIVYQPRWEGNQVITAHFMGDEKYPHVEITRTVNFAGPSPEHRNESSGLVPVRRWMTPLAGFGVIAFWALLIFVALRTLTGISRARKQTKTDARDV